MRKIQEELAQIANEGNLKGKEGQGESDKEKFGLLGLTDIFKNKNQETMHPTIQQGLATLQNANYSGYFEAMDKVVPQSLQGKLSELRMQFISGDTTWKFAQQLEIFAREVDKVTAHEDVENNSKMNRQNSVFSNPNYTTDYFLSITLSEIIEILESEHGKKTDKRQIELYLHFLSDDFYKAFEPHLLKISLQEAKVVDNESFKTQLQKQRQIPECVRRWAKLKKKLPNEYITEYMIDLGNSYNLEVQSFIHSKFGVSPIYERAVIFNNFLSQYSEQEQNILIQIFRVKAISNPNNNPMLAHLEECIKKFNNNKNSLKIVSAKSQPNLKTLYNTLNQQLNDESLTLFCQLNFEEVHNNFTTGQSKINKISALLDYAKRKDLLGKLEQDLTEFLA